MFYCISLSFSLINLYHKFWTTILTQGDRDNIIKTKASLYQNFSNSFSRIMKDKDRCMAFVTSTLLPEDRIKNNQDKPYEEIIKNQHHLLKSFSTNVRHDKKNRDSDYFRALELHKSGDLHIHQLNFIPDTLDYHLSFINVIKRSKKIKNIGRIDVRFLYKYKKQLIKELDLKCHKYVRKGKSFENYYENKDDYKSGSALVITFFNDDRESARDIVRYIMKYTSKSLSYSDKKSNEFYIFRKLGIRPFSYSNGVLPSLTAYQKVRSDLIIKNKKYSDLYELQNDIDQGLVKFETFYEKVDSIHTIKSSERVIKADFSRSYPVIYTEFEDNEYLETNGYSYLKSIVVSFSDKSPDITWEMGKYEKHFVNFKKPDNIYKTSSGFYEVIHNGTKQYALYKTLEDAKKAYPALSL